MAQSSAASAPPSRRSNLLRFAWRSSLLALAGGVLSACVFAGMPRTYQRVGMLEAAGVVYAALDWWRPRAEQQLGPAPPSEARSMLPVTELLGELEQAFTAQRFTLVYEQPAPVPVAVDFRHEDFEHPRCAEFRIAAADLLRESPDPFALCERVRSLTRHDAVAVENPHVDPIHTLALARTGEPLSCRYFTTLFDACARSRGYTTRMLSLSARGKHFDHAVSEVYLPEHGKWVLIDCDFNLAYRRAGVWLSAAEIQQVWLQWQQAFSADSARIPSHPAERAAAIERWCDSMQFELVELGPAAQDLRAKNLRQGSHTGLNLELFEHILYPARNDYLSDEYPRGHPAGVRMYRLSATPTEQWLAICPEAMVLEKPDALYWSVGACEIRGAVPEGTEPALALSFFTYTPNFTHFEVTHSDAEDWQKVDGNTLVFPVSNGEHMLRVRTKNAAGMAGEITTLRVTCESQSPGQ